MLSNALLLTLIELLLRGMTMLFQRYLAGAVGAAGLGLFAVGADGRRLCHDAGAFRSSRDGNVSLRRGIRQTEPRRHAPRNRKLPENRRADLVVGRAAAVFPERDCCGALDWRRARIRRAAAAGHIFAGQLPVRDSFGLFYRLRPGAGAGAGGDGRTGGRAFAHGGAASRRRGAGRGRGLLRDGAGKFAGMPRQHALSAAYAPKDVCAGSCSREPARHARTYGKALRAAGAERVSSFGACDAGAVSHSLGACARRWIGGSVDGGVWNDPRDGVSDSDVPSGDFYTPWQIFWCRSWRAAAQRKIPHAYTI